MCCRAETVGSQTILTPKLMAASTTYGLTPPTELFRAMLPNIRNGDPLNKYRWIWSHAGAEL